MPRCLTRSSLALLLLLSSEVWALGLGEVRIESSLNEPLRAEIELLAASAEEVQALQVSLASAETFERYGIERPYYLQELVFEVVRSGSAGGNVIRIRSNTPMTEPFLTFLVEAVWANGRMLREYTVLLDPPTFAPPASTPTQPEVTAPARAEPADSGRIERQAEPQSPVASPTTPTPAPARPPVSGVAEPTPAPATTAEQEPFEAPADEEPYEATAGGDYSVVRGDTLWGIASRIRPDSRLTMNQTMLAIFEANPEAFGGNINILRAGAELRIPAADDIYRIDRTDAFNEALRQNEAWSGGVAVTAPPVPAPDAESRPSLTLVPPDEETTAPDTSVTGETAAEPGDETAVREQEILDRIAELEAADVPIQRALIEIRDNELANLRRELAEMRGELYEPPADETADPFIDDEAATETPEDALFPDVEESADDEAADVESAGDEEAVVDEPVATPADADSTTTIARRESGPSFVDQLMAWATNMWLWLGIVLLIVIGILVWFMRRGGSDEPDAWGGRFEAGDVGDETLAATESLRAPSRHEDSIVVVEQTGGFRKRDREQDTVQVARPAAIDDTLDQTGMFGSLEDTFSSDTAVNLDQSDPIAEADFHMAYGLYDQAAELVNGALQAEPDRDDLLTKLCEIYFVWGNRDAFVVAAQRLHAATGGASDDWDKIVIMGQQIAPDHALFAGVAGATRAVDLSFGDEDAGGTGALDMDFGAEDTAVDEDVIDLGGDGDEDGLDFVFGDETGTKGTVDMPRADRTVETPTLRNRFGSKGPATDATTEIDLDDLGFELDGLDETELADLGDDDATELASLDALDSLDETGKNEAVVAHSDTSRNPRVSANDTGLMADFDFDDDEFSSTRTGMRLAPDETGVNPALSTADETDGDIDVDLLAATGRTQVLSEDFTVNTYSGDGASIGDNDKTMLARRLGADDFDFAKTEALPPGTYPGDNDATGELAAIGSTDVDLDLDDLTEALKQSVKGDTVEQRRDDATVEHRRDDATVEHRRPYLEDDETDETLSFAPEDLSDDLDEARTMTEVGTKLDLARAYVDMGDPAGARSILEEVLDEGDSGQRQQAQKLLDSLH